MALLEARGVWKEYDGREVLMDINLSVKKGEILVVMGPSGAGKTTLLRILSLIDRPSRGEVLFEGRDTMEPSLALRRRIAMVLQGRVTFDTTVYENVAYGLMVRGMREGEIKGRVAGALELVGLSGYEGRRARTLSWGEAQRLGFAMATVFQPEVLLLDEPTANLDPTNEGVIDEIIRRIKGLGITVVIATHKQAKAYDLADRIAVMNDGKVEQLGSGQEVFYRPGTPFVAAFIGVKNIFEGRVLKADSSGVRVATRGLEVLAPYTDVREGARVHLCIRPEEVLFLRRDRPLDPGLKNVFTGRVVGLTPRGTTVRVGLQVGEDLLVADIPRHVAEKMAFAVGQEMRVSLKSEAIHIIPG